MEGALLGLFMISACAFTTLLEHPASPVRRALPMDWERRVLIGLAMACTALSIFYSPWGKRSGAHINPSTTLTFYRLGKIGGHDALWYAAAQFGGAIVGVGVAVALFGMAVMDPAVRYVVTLPGQYGAGVAFIAECTIAFLLMTVVLAVSSSPRWQRYTGLCAATLVFVYISLEAPLSGMSMNPARSLGPALVGHEFTALWVYFLAPPIGMLVAAQLHLAVFGQRDALCA